MINCEVYQNITCNKICNFCGKNTHMCRQCPIETKMAPIFKKYIGTLIEKFIANKYMCTCCNKKTLIVLGNHTPSLDIICTSCLRKFEVKSKCLSIEHLPNNIILPHGSYDKYIERQNTGLDLFVVIYNVDRIKKIITIREVLYATHKDITINSNIKVVRRELSNLSIINIKDRNLLTKMELDNIYKFDFSSLIDSYIELN